LDHPTSGEIIIDEVATATLESDDRTNFRLANLGYVFQDYALLPELTAVENILVPLLMLGYKKKDATVLAVKALEKVGLKDKLDNLPSQMSGGQQQRVSIARAIANNPKILFADEPTANLDSETSQVILDVFKELNQAGQTIVMVTHESEYAREADKIIELKDGKIVS
jgi:putative ABC transport system ATP-binding protein